ncbi:MAG: ribose transport system ATP-binding protein [Thermoleophilaceae bacterium]|nr:ribose transport system ATP-binding protein [Thermoleophilaceae bacterium]
MTAAPATGEATFGIRGATQDFSGVRALQDVDFMMTAGTVHGLVGENGSGKSTLIKIVTGALSATAGQLFTDEGDTSFSSPADAQKHGVGVVHQDYHLFPDLNVAANVYGVSKPPPRRRWSRIVDKAEVARRVNALFSDLGIDIAPSARVRDLGSAERKFVEVARAMLLRPRFLILDEPTASLEPQAAASVLSLLERLRDQGVGLAFVSHRLDEVLRISDQVTVLRDGRRVACKGCAGMKERDLAEMIIGRVHEERRRSSSSATDEVALSVRGLQLRGGVPEVGFELKRGEILGFTGLLGSGAAEIVRMLGGAEPLKCAVEIDGRPVKIGDPRDASRAGIGFIPEDRKAIGLVQEQSIAVNISLPSLGSVSSFGWVDRPALDKRADEYRDRLQIRAPNVRTPVKSLSGGNQQKVMLAKWLASGVRILAIEEPTHGIDIGGKVQVHDLLRQLAKDGGSIVVASTDVREVLSLCDRIGVMRHGRLVDVITSSELSHADLAALGAQDSEQFIETLIEGGRAKETA